MVKERGPTKADEKTGEAYVDAGAHEYLGGTFRWEPDPSDPVWEPGMFAVQHHIEAEGTR